MYTEQDISNPPVFDFDRAIQAKETTYRESFYRLPNMAAAANLWLYNSPEIKWPTVISKLRQLYVIESEATLPSCLLPTIGWEVEIPRKPFNSFWSAKYALFFDLLDLPRNRIHKNVIPGKEATYPHDMWEFSTTPAFSAAVANRTLAELIKGNFIPHLEIVSGNKPPTSEDRSRLLDKKLVSLHVNLGFPEWLESCKPVVESNINILTFGSSFALAFSSPERLYWRSQSGIITVKNAEPTTKSLSTEPHRFEIKALEVSGSKTYRQIEEIQLLAAAVFCAIGEIPSPLTAIWLGVRNKINNIYEHYNVRPQVVLNKATAFNLVRESNIQKELRQVLSVGAHMVRLYLQQKK